MRQNFFLIVILLFSVMGYGQVPIVMDESLDGDFIGRDIGLLEDPNGSMTVEQILAKESAEFRSFKQNIPNFGTSTSVFWGRFTLHNPTPQDLTVYLEQSYAPTDIFTLFYFNEGQLETVTLGDRIPRGQLLVESRTPVFPLVLPPGDSTFYFRSHSHGVVQFPLKIWSVSAFSKSQLVQQIMVGAVFGAIFIMLLYNLFLSFIYKDFLYYIYIAYLAFQITWSAGVHGVSYLYAPEGISIWMANEGHLVGSQGAGICAIFLAISFLSLRSRVKWVYYILLLFAVVLLADIAITLYNYNLGLKVLYLTTFLASVVVLACAFWSSYQRYRPAYFYTLSWCVFFFGLFTQTLASNGIIATNSLTHWGPFLGVALQTAIISLALGDKMKLAREKSELAVKLLNESLEAKVEEKTRDIRSIMSNINLGIFAIEGAGLCIHRDYSKKLEEIVGQNNLTGKNALKILFADSNLGDDDQSLIESTIQSCLNEPDWIFSANSHQFESLTELVRQTRDGAGRILELDWSPMLDNMGNVEKILVTLKDVTEMRRLKDIFHAREVEFEYIMEIINIENNDFYRFIETSREFIEENRRLIGSSHSYNFDAIKIMFINFHTIKGMARSLGFKAITNVVHNAEQRVSNVQKKLADWDPALLRADTDEVSAQIEKYEEIKVRKLGGKEAGVNQLSVNKEELEALDPLVRDMQMENLSEENSKVLQKVACILNQSLYSDADVFFNDVLSAAERLARDLGKEKPRIDIESNGFRLSLRAQEMLRNVFIHIVRNALDHGIESAEQRLQKAKDIHGLIQLRLSEDNQGLRIDFEDDGQGLALKKIKEIGLEKNLIDKDREYTPHEIAELIFASGFTTSSTLTDISGRGVGMDAIRKYLANGDSRIEILLKEKQHENGWPFLLSLYLPKSMYRPQESIDIMAQEMSPGKTG